MEGFLASPLSGCEADGRRPVERGRRCCAEEKKSSCVRRDAISAHHRWELEDLAATCVHAGAALRTCSTCAGFGLATFFLSRGFSLRAAAGPFLNPAVFGRLLSPLPAPRGVPLFGLLSSVGGRSGFTLNIALEFSTPSAVPLWLAAAPASSIPCPCVVLTWPRRPP